MLQNKTTNKLKSINLLTIFSILALSIILFFWKNSKINVLLELMLALLEFIFISKYLVKEYGSKIKILIFISLILILVKILDGAFMPYYFRFFTDVIVLFYGGAYLLKNKHHNLTFNETTLLLFAPLAIIFLPYVFEDGLFSLLISLSIPLCFVLLWLYNISNQKLLIIGLSLLLFAGFAFIFFPNYIHYNNSEQLKPGKTIDSRAALTLIRQNADSTSLSEMGNKIVILDVWYSGCGVCFKKFPEFEALTKEYAQDTNLYFAALNIPLEKEKDTLGSFGLVKKYSFNKLQATSTIDENKWGIELGYPTLLVFDKNHKIRYSGTLNTNRLLLVNNIHEIIEQLKKE